MSSKWFDDYTKQDWLDHNTHGPITDDTMMYRVFRVDHLQHDLDSSILTLVNPCYETQQDPLENPLKEASFDVEGRGHKLFHGLMSEYYTQSWSLTEPAWGYFGQGHDTIRLACKARSLFDRLYDEDDPFGNLYYHMAIVSYLPSVSIETGINSNHFDSYLDSQGLGLLRTLITIRADFVAEKEIRLVYVRSPRDDYSHPLRHQISGSNSQLCHHLFDWKNLISDYTLCPKNVDVRASRHLSETLMREGLAQQ